MKRNFVVVAADSRVREALAGDLRARGYSVTRASTAAAAEKIVRSVAVDAVLIESHVPDCPPEKLAARLRKLRPDCRVVVVTSFDQVRNTPDQLRYGADDYLLRAAQVLDMLAAPFDAEKKSGGDGFSERASEALISVVDVLVGLLELDDRHFTGSSHQATRLSREVAEELAADAETVREIVIATLLRDIGKVGLDDDLLNVAGRFTEDQQARMQAHVEGSLRLLEHVDFPWKVLPIIRHHHERYNGKGYPDGLQGREIPMGARIVAVVDAYIAMTSGRNHRGPSDTESALTRLVGEAGRHFDPEVLEAFQRVIDKRSIDVEGTAKPKVLFARVQDEFRNVLKMRLVNEGCEVDDVEGFDQALAFVRESAPNLVIADLDDGADEALRFLREVRGDAELCGLPVAFVTERHDRILKLRALREGADDFLNKVEDLEETAARVRNILAREQVRRGKRSKAPRRGITGDLENLGVADIVQILAMGMKTACVTLRSNGDEGRIWLENGAARHALLGQERGEDAFYAMVGWGAGEFVIEHNVRTRDTTIDQDALFLVMEGLRRMDEAANDGEAAKAAS